MEEAQGWLLLVEEGERRCLGVWAFAAAREIPIRTHLFASGPFCSAEASVFAISASAITDANSAIE